MRTPNGGHRSTQWVIQYRVPPTDGAVVTWTRGEMPPQDTAALVRETLQVARDKAPAFEWRAIRIETVQRVEDW